MYEVVVALEDEYDKRNLQYTKKAITKSSGTNKPMHANVYDFREEILKMQGVLEQVQKFPTVRYHLFWDS